MTGSPIFGPLTQFATQFVPGANSGTSALISTAEANSVILVAVTTSADDNALPGDMGVASITADGVVFQRYAATNVDGCVYTQATGIFPFYYNGVGKLAFELWWAPSAALFNAAITVTMTDPVARGGFCGLAVYGCLDYLSPWDANASFPSIVAVTGGEISDTVSSDNPDTALCIFSAQVTDAVGPSPPLPDSPVGHYVFDPALGASAGTGASVSQSGAAAIVAPSFSGLMSGSRQTAVLAGQMVTSVTDFFPPLNASILIVAALVGVPPSPPPALNMGNVVVTSLATESPCTVAQFPSPPDVGGPAAGLRWSDTRGQTFGNAVAQALGTDPLTQLQWNRTGYARDRVFELFWSAAAKTALNGAFVIVEPWKS